MGRQPRTFAEDGIYHLWAHGSDSRSLFVCDEDRRHFLRRLAAIVEHHELICIGFCLMGNHHHLVVQTPDRRLSRAMQELHTGYSQAFNKEHGHTAHLFRSRFGARHVTSDADLLGTLCYLAYNPVRAGFCSNPEAWLWSSYRANAGLDAPPPFMSEEALCAAVGGSSWRTRYASFVEANRSRCLASTPPAPADLVVPLGWGQVVAMS
jgi:putative transposase